jgi:tetratricopeptide (TPR) repeat protein
MGRIYSKHKNISKLQKIIIQMEDEKIFTIEYFQLKAIFYFLQKNYNEMMNVYRDSLDNFPEAEELLYDLATVYAKVFHQFEISIEINKKNLQSNFRNLSYWKLLEFCFDRLHYF